MSVTKSNNLAINQKNSRRMCFLSVSKKNNDRVLIQFLIMNEKTYASHVYEMVLSKLDILENDIRFLYSILMY